MHSKILTLDFVQSQQHQWIKNLKLSFTPEAWTAILGRSGVGKTTLLQIISGLLPLHLETPELQISAHWSELWGRGMQEQVALMSQQHALLPWANALDNVLMGARLRGAIQPKARQEALDFLDKVGLKERADAYMFQLSGGMQQRVGLARVLFENRPMVCLDEPFSALDAVTKAELYPVVKAQLVGRTVIQVTHDPWEALQLADQIYVLAGSPACLVWQWARATQHQEALADKAALVTQMIEAMR